MKKYNHSISGPVNQMFDLASDFYTSPAIQDLDKGMYHGNLILLGPKQDGVWMRKKYEPMFDEIVKRYGKDEWNDPDKLKMLLKQWSVFDREHRDRDCGILIDPYEGFNLEGIGVWVNQPNLRAVEKAIYEVESIKDDVTNGRHIAAAHFTTLLPGNVSIAGSEGQRTLITFSDGEIVPEFTIYRNHGELEFQKYVRDRLFFEVSDSSEEDEPAREEMAA